MCQHSKNFIMERVFDSKKESSFYEFSKKQNLLSYKDTYIKSHISIHSSKSA